MQFHDPSPSIIPLCVIAENISKKKSIDKTRTCVGLFSPLPNAVHNFFFILHFYFIFLTLTCLQVAEGRDERVALYIHILFTVFKTKPPWGLHAKNILFFHSLL